MIGPCTKQLVRATIVTKSGIRFAGTNYVRKHQLVCPRAGMETGHGYELCRDICQQVGHAEISAIHSMRSFGIHAGVVCYIEGHTYACVPCKEALAAVGITDIRFEAPPVC